MKQPIPVHKRPAKSGKNYTEMPPQARISVAFTDQKPPISPPTPHMPTWTLPFNRTFSNFRRLIQRRVRYRVTLGGILFLLALSLTGAIAFLSGNNLLFLIFAVMLALLLV